MRCPKCRYISFGSDDRCRNCGYELLPTIEAPPLDLPIETSGNQIGPFDDFVLSERGPGLAARPAPAEAPQATSDRRADPSSRLDLPLFGGGQSRDDAPLVTPPAIPRTPLSVRRSQPVARPRGERDLLTEEPGADRAAIVRRIVSRTDGQTTEAAPARTLQPDGLGSDALETASVPARLFGGLIDVLVLATIDGAILYFTLRLVELPLDAVLELPAVPLGVFLLLLNGGYLAVFTAAGGQTIGKMLTGIKVVADQSAEALESDGVRLRVSLGAAVLRATAYLLSLLPAGLGFAAILFDSDGRALHDRLAETRVVKA